MTRPLYRGNGFAANHSRGWDGDRDHHHRREYWGGFGYGYGYPYYYNGLIYTGDVDPWLFGPDDYDNPNGYAADNNYGGYAGYGNDVPAPYRDYGEQPYAPDSSDDQQAAPQSWSGRPSYNGPATTSSGGPDAGENSVTVIFKDGRPAAQIHNYLLTSTTLTVLDAQRRQIPLDDVNLDATVAANRAAGIDFRVPGAQR